MQTDMREHILIDYYHYSKMTPDENQVLINALLEVNIFFTLMLI